jgi:hypothetical protein
MGIAFGAIVTIVIIIAGIAQALAPVFKSIAEANEKAKRQSMPQPGRARGRNSNDPGSFLPEMTQQGVSRPTPVVSQPANVVRSSGAARGKSERPKKQKGAAKGKSSSSTASGSPGSGVGAHVASYISQHVKTHIGNQISDSVKHDIGDQVRNHLGEDKNKPTAPTVETTHGSVAAGSLLSALRSPQGVRQAILINEVLSKPKALRRS